MPKGQPFTALCQLAARLAQPRVADLHTHTTASDGDFTPAQVVAFARQAGLSAVAVTDHDTTHGAAEAARVAHEWASAPEVIPGIEVSATFADREVHLLGYFVDVANVELRQMCDDICARRRQRFRAYLAELPALPAGLAEVEEQKAVSLGRRHVAGLLVRAGVVRSRFGAFQRMRGITPAVSHCVPAADAVRTLRAAGGVVSLAHPPDDTDEPTLAALRELGLAAVEVAFPAASVAHTTRLRDLAGRLGLAVTGGSDCHGGEVAGRAVGARGVTRDELAALRRLAGQSA